MKCQRCSTDARVTRHTVDDYSGYLCSECREVWTEIQQRMETRGRFSR